MNSILSFFITNYKPVISSFLLALLLWIVVTTDRHYTMKIEVPLKISRVASGYVLSSTPPGKVLVEVGGKGRALIGLIFYKKSIDLELPEIDISTRIQLMDYKNRFNIARELGVEIVEIIEPKTIDIRVDRFVERRVPVKLESFIRPAPGYILTNINADQDSVSISGPAEMVKKTNLLKTEPIIREGVKYPFNIPVRIISPNPGLVQVQPEDIGVHVGIEQLVERTIREIPVQIVGVPPDLEARAVPPNILVRIKGGQSAVTEIGKDQFTAIFNYRREFRTGQFSYEPHIEAPDKVTVIGVQPQEFRLHLMKKEDFE